MPGPTPFGKLLIANRGEIALRILRTARAMGFETVAVYSTADAGAPHVRAADESVCIGAPAPAESYLNIGRIVEAARATGAGAIHPGYGFLAERADFAQACADAGLVFVGPSAAAIRAIGDKAGAKTLMAAAGVPCLPGYQGEDQDDARLRAEAGRLGYPLMIKAAAGGGGRGMRLVRRAEDFAPLLAGARSESLAAFGDARLLLERALAKPRHVEVQIFADRYGHAIHLGERDCSVQRRHQKLIEESPSPAVGADLRYRIGAAAVDAVRAAGYEGAGTVEFLLDGDGAHYFIEMNARLQVEHPVTEAVTGLDLVEWQLRIAGGERLTISQPQVRIDGHAIEVRLCAEDARRDFAPQSGRLGVWRASPLLRVEHGLESGAAIPPHYDSMLAKLVAHGRDREEARRRLRRGLAETVALGITTNQAFLAACLGHPSFAAGEATTAFIAANRDELLAQQDAGIGEALAVAAALLYPPGREPGVGPLSIPVRLRIQDSVAGAAVTHEGSGACRVRAEGGDFELRLLEVGAHDAFLVCNGVGRTAVFHREGATLDLHYRGRPWRIEDVTREAALRPSSTAADGSLRASMNGRVVRVSAAVGDAVDAGQPILTLEAMKMEHVHAAPLAGRVKAIHVRVGDQVAADRVVAVVEP